MALVMLLFGQPDNRETVGGRGGAGPAARGRRRASATGNNPLAESGGAPGAGGGGGGRGGAGGGGGPSGGVKLSYVPNPDRGLPDGLTLEFRTTNLGMRLLRNDEIEAAIERARQRQIVWPSQINFTVNAEGRLPDVEDLFGAETRDLLDPNSPARQSWRAPGGGEASQDIGVDASFSFFRSNTGDTYVASVFELDEEKLTWNGDTASLQVFYNVVDALGTVIGYDERSVEVSRGAAGSPTILEMPMQMAPGSYKVFAGVRDPATDIHGALVREIESPDFSSGAFMLSSIVRFSDGAPRRRLHLRGRAAPPGGWDSHFTPRLSEVYEPGGDLRLVFNAYGYDTSAEPNLDWQITFKKDGSGTCATTRAPSTSRLPTFRSPSWMSRWRDSSPTAEGRFEPGDYTAEITVRDRVGGQSLTEVVAFQVSGS